MQLIFFYLEHEHLNPDVAAVSCLTLQCVTLSLHTFPLQSGLGWALVTLWGRAAQVGGALYTIAAY